MIVAPGDRLEPVDVIASMLGAWVVVGLIVLAVAAVVWGLLAVAAWLIGRR